jgi:uncharacterized protein YjbI with pentapeptide repeats
MDKKINPDYHEAPDRDKLKKLNPDELKRILEAHEIWLASDGKDGERANLQSIDLSGANLAVANLEQALLAGADLRGANCYKARLRKSDLSQTNFHNADLREADLTESTSLQLEQLSGANLSNAKLPEGIIGFNGLKNIEDASKNAQKVFFLMIFLCIYSWLTIGATTHADLISNYPTSKLPIVNVPIKIASFYICTPVIILFIYFYYQIIMQRLWELLSAMPAAFPDGEPLDKKVYPWLLTGLFRSYFQNLKVNKRLPFSGLQNFLSIFSAWFIVPLTLYLFWGNYLYRHEIIGAFWLLLLSTVSSAFCIMSFRFARNTLKGTKEIFWSRLWTSSTVLVCLVILFPITLTFIYGLTPQSKLIFTTEELSIWLPNFLYQHHLTGAYLVESDISIKPSNWSGSKDQELDYVKGAQLNGVNLRNALAMRCFLVKAKLQNADMQGAWLQGADLRKSDLSGANLQGAMLYSTDLRWAIINDANLKEAYLHADFTGASLDRVKFKGAKLQGADFENSSIRFADLEGADFSGANLKGAVLYVSNLKGSNLGRTLNMEGTNLSSVNLQGANLIGAKGLKKDQVQKAKNFLLAYYDQKMLLELGLPKNHNDMIQLKNLRGARLRGANLSGADLSGFDLQNADLRGAYLGSFIAKDPLFPLTSLERANLKNANLSKINLQGSNLRNANLEGAKLSEAKLQWLLPSAENPLIPRTSLEGSNLKNADLHKVDLRGADLRNVNFEGAKLGEAKLQGADLTGATGLTKKQIDSAIIDEKTKLP